MVQTLMQSKWVRTIFLYGALTLAASSQNVSAQTVRLILPYPAGGSADALARSFGVSLASHLGRPVVVENKPGGGTTIGAFEVVKAPADGNTILLTTAESTMAIVPLTLKNPSYDPLRDLSPVMILGTSPTWLVVRADRAERSLADVIETIKRNPGEFTFSTNIAGGSVHLVLEYWKKVSGLQFIVVPYTGIPKVLPDLLGGRLGATFDPIGGTAELVSTGKLRAIALFDKQRSPSVPDVPSFAETANLPDLSMLGSYVFALPSGTPPQIIKNLNQTFAEVVKDKSVKDRMVQLAIDPILSSPEEAKVYVQKLNERFAVLIKEANFSPN